ncbi:putative membrane protein [Saccharicrinis fermentans DSM 9555 = JCM 21142]|uniref:Putative membrane protein n=1 Tax=Saccharicrinis fermentans DSM 9555 = JCM 21142 TaxID=869213 RepID=W7YPQ0_9BACT|nr:putative membrane protein [Saccharicrinis fermentans DSM 9555 = JCM 21142]
MSNHKNKIGIISLLISILGLITVQWLISVEFLLHPYWYILLSGFEAATIGGVADWFAVSALFHEIKIPFVKKHTNIIVRNRVKLTEGVVDLVTNKWLAPEIIKEKIAEFSIVKNIMEALRLPKNKKRVVGFFKDTLVRLTRELDTPEMVGFIQSIMREQMKDLNVASPVGSWMKRSIHEGAHEPLWRMVFSSAQKTIFDNTTRLAMLNLVEKQLQEYKREGLFKGIFLGIAGGLGVMNSEVICDKILTSMNSFIEHAKDDPKHQLRMKVEDRVLRFSEQLISGDPEAVKMMDVWKQKIINNTDAQHMIRNLLSNLRESLSHQLTKNESEISGFIEKNMDKVLLELEGDKDNQDKIDRWLRFNISELIVKYHPEIGRWYV